MKKTLIVALALLSVACAKKEPTTPADYFASSAYQSRELMQRSLFRSDQAVLSAEEIDEILGSRIELPSDAHLAVLRLGSSEDLLGWAFLTGTNHPFAVLAETPELSRVSWLPSLLIPEKLTVPLLREAAARFQADLLLIYRTPCQQFQDYRLFGNDTAHTYCVAEGVLLDVRTGIVPFSTAVPREVQAKETGADVSFYETMKKAEAAAVSDALSDLASQLSTFLQAGP
jgi:hypothetical protein